MIMDNRLNIIELIVGLIVKLIKDLFLEKGLEKRIRKCLINIWLHEKKKRIGLKLLHGASKYLASVWRYFKQQNTSVQ